MQKKKKEKSENISCGRNYFATFSSEVWCTSYTIHVVEIDFKELVRRDNEDIHLWGVSHIQSECGKIWARKTPNTDTFRPVTWKYAGKGAQYFLQVCWEKLASFSVFQVIGNAKPLGNEAGNKTGTVVAIQMFEVFFLFYKLFRIWLLFLY